MTIGTGRAVHRDQSTGHNTTGQLQEERNKSNITAPPLFRRAIVIDVFYDLSLLTEERIAELDEEVSNTDMISQIKRNCILAKEIGNDASSTLKPLIYYPLLDPYICLPVKPGETVLVLYEDPAMNTADAPFWLCRAPAPIVADDVNYTHDDRKFTPLPDDLDAIDKLEPVDPNEKIDFKNGSNVGDSISIGSSADEFDKIFNDASASSAVQLEPVPRYNKRPGDYVLQGSNNTLISLGTDRTGPASNIDEIAPARAAIDIVVGRGNTATTAPNVIETTRDTSEVDKNPIAKKLTDVPTEGDPDFVNDSSRIYIAQNTLIDEHFNINIADGGEAATERANAIGIKSDQIRAIARDDIKIQAGTNETGAAIVLKASGDIILIPGPQGLIYLGGQSVAHAPLCNEGAAVAGQVVGTPITSTMGGTVGNAPAGSGAPWGCFSTKVLLRG